MAYCAKHDQAKAGLMGERVVAQPDTTLLKVLLGATICSSALHYTHNFVMASMYPPLPPLFPTPLAFQIGIVIAWPLLTAVGLWGYRQYAAGRLRRAGWALIVYSTVGTTTIGHFLGPIPEIPPFFMVTIFTDFITGAAMLIFGIATLRAARPEGGATGLMAPVDDAR